MSTRSEKSIRRTLARLQRKGGAALWVAMVAPLVGGGLLVWQAWTLAHILGDAIEAGVPTDTLLPSVLILVGLLIARAGLGALGEQAGLAGAEAIKLDLRRALFAQRLTLSPRDANAAASGHSASAIVDHVEALDGYFARYLPAMIQAGMLPLVFGAIILPLDWVAGVLFLVTAPLIPLFMALVGWGAQIATDRQAQALSHLSGRFADRLRGLLTLKLFGRADVETAGIVQASEALRVRTLRVLRIAFLSSAVLEFFAALGVAGVALYVGLTFIDYLQLRTSPLTLSTGMFLLLMAPEVYAPLRLLAAHYHDRSTAKAALLEIEAQLGALPAATTELEDIPQRPGTASGLALSGVALWTPDRMSALLHDVSLTVAPAQHVAIIGASGSGKSTLLEMVARLREHEGQVLVGGLPLERWSEAELRARSFLLPQKPRLIHASIADNIALARPHASRWEIERAAELALVTPFAAALPDGLDTVIGEDGLGLSGGQAQRVAVARLFLRQAGLILLDEPTAHLDSALEEEVIDNILAFAQGRTLLVATHSTAIASRMDKVWRLAGGNLMPVPHLHKQRNVA